MNWLKNSVTKLKEKIRPIAKRWQFWRLLIVLCLSLFLVMSVYFVVLAKTAHVKNLQATLAQTTTVYDDSGAKAGELYSQKGTYVSYDKISQNMRDAVISSEDRNFYHEYGFSIKGIVRAALLNLKNKVMGSSAIAGGGSTLTQQLVKNAYLTQEQTITRKAKEIFLSMQVEQDYTKNQILTMYLNNAWFGHGVWGVEDAAQKYFGVHASELTTSQAATLTAMLPSPALYNPIDHPQASINRRNVVLGTMLENKKLTSAQLKSAQAAPMNLNDTYDNTNNYKYPWFFDAVINEAIKTYGLTEGDVMNRGYKIYTTLNQQDQANLQADFNNPGMFNYNTDAQAASVVLNAKNGGVRAIVGAREKNHTFRGFNYATQSKLQPGSAIKPIAVYAPALERGYSIDELLPNTTRTFGTSNKEIHNALNVQTEDVPMYSALEHSYNVPAVYLLNKMGVNAGFTSTRKFGLPLSDKDKSLALALGGLTDGVSPMQMAQAYTAFANDGVMSQTHLITKIVDATGKVIVAQPKATQTRVISSRVADNMTRMMLGTYTNGTGLGATPAGFTIAGKTGTTENPNDTENAQSSKDSWAMAYTKDVVQATWMGLDDNSKNNSLPLGLTATMGPLVKTSLEQILPNTPGTNFSVTNPNQPVKNKQSGNSMDWSNIVSDFSNGVDKAVDGANKTWHTIKGLFGGN
ncbi:PBP1A family penicillin-binding protein [Leuconostoc citreum]|uniref:PBP1A family penicillin-binding protein n=1 Tax=Leuconostoc citreum TaxID=33964 RepID=UPI002182226C|nr:PBP1A family penicillin-binding protein [Leuconostoc citreum]MCS8583857.1 PBP1A family penicillin-binding protein [Leuconostoc citreum]MCS8601583.1 PBP1A family penicillin-binding protein [Leuconostoc citreum]